ncbi:hypothetical protein MSAN_00219300 [Mycena sanguinolenta]|uniref:Uncharacterized protein n=1 Tax=Mycena sanguinolenta TaxID=230812 RepID=A0A8H6ZI37_9AGAR|nr:hypothetical protein MSAN_00219300 [Mycena sanguinolenta]
MNSPPAGPQNRQLPKNHHLALFNTDITSIVTQLRTGPTGRIGLDAHLDVHLRHRLFFLVLFPRPSLTSCSYAQCTAVNVSSSSSDSAPRDEASRLKRLLAAKSDHKLILAYVRDTQSLSHYAA